MFWLLLIKELVWLICCYHKRSGAARAFQDAYLSYTLLPLEPDWEELEGRVWLPLLGSYK